jgi:tRNA 2-thiouridine synthesizing protein A
MDWDAELDAVGLLCPLPVLKARKRLQRLRAGQVLRVLADDPAGAIDFPHFCAEQGHELISQSGDENSQIYLIRKRG